MSKSFGAYKEAFSSVYKFFQENCDPPVIEAGDAKDAVDGFWAALVKSAGEMMEKYQDFPYAKKLVNDTLSEIENISLWKSEYFTNGKASA